MKIAGVYKIQSRTKPERIYIGSSIDINNRWNVHLSDLKKGKHHSPKLQYHFNKYGKNDFIFTILICCNKDDLIITEQFYLDCYKPYFNINSSAGSRLGVAISDETRRRMSNGHKGLHWKLSQETKKKMSNAAKGKKKSDEWKKNMSLKMREIKLGKKRGKNKILKVV